jgi:ATP-binding cassette, subfamily B, bacterial
MHGGGWWAFIAHDEKKGKPKINRALIIRVYEFAKSYLGLIGSVLILIMTISIIELVPPLLYRDLFDTVIPNSDTERLKWLALGMVGLPLISNVLGVAQRYLSAKMGEGLIFDLRQKLYTHLQDMSLRFFTHTRQGEIISRLNNDVVGAQSAVTGTIPNIITNTFSLITTLAIMFSIEWRLTIISILVLPLFLIPAKRVGRILRKIRRQAMEYNADLSSIISETLTINGALLVKTFGRQFDEQARFRDINDKVKNIGIRRALIGRWFMMGLGIASTIGVALNYWVGGYFAITKVISTGTIVAFVAYLSRLYGPISALSNVQVEFVGSMVSFERVFEYLDMPIEIQDKPNAIEISETTGKIVFDNVSFDYSEANKRLGIELEDAPSSSQNNGQLKQEEKDEFDQSLNFVPTRRWALDNINFTIEPGQLVALVGPSGAGKTSLTYLLPRLYDPTSGTITLDGTPLQDINQISLASHIGMVTQETYLFHQSIRNNLYYAKPDATEEQLEAATKAANIYDFIDSLPNRFDTKVGEKGYRLSGGEKQRMAIARVVLKNPSILILDEATSHLDSTSESLIQEALVPLMKGRTSIVIAHRLSTILAADQILVMDKGILVEHGTHESLLANKGLYAELFDTQFRSMPSLP